MSRKIVITGITSFRNHGVEALVVSTVEQLRARVPDAVFTVLDRAPDYDASRMSGGDVKFVHDYTIRPLYAGRARRLLTKAIPSVDRDAQTAANELRSACCVVASGGDVFCSEYGHRSLLSHLQPLKIARSANVPFVIHAQSIGPFTSEADRTAFVDVAKDAAAVTVRESASYRYITGELELDSALCRLVADPAFLLKPCEGEEGKALFRHHRAVDGRPTIALSTSNAICHWMGSDDGSHVETWLEVIGWLRSELDANIVLIPHVQETSAKNDDRVLATRLLRRLGHDPRVRLAGGDFSAGDFKAIISQCDFVIAERMHAAIAGLGTGVPTLVIGYSIKAEGILTDLLGADLTQSAALSSFQEFLQPGAGLARVQAAWAARPAVAAALQASLPSIREKSLAAYESIAEACGARV